MAQPTVRVGVTNWEDIPGERIEAYWARLREAGAEAVDLRSADRGIASLDGLVLTGGLDVDPAGYGAARHLKVKQTDAARDEFELALLRAALAADQPVLAICRGHQLLNVAFGGTLLQHIEGGAHRADFKTEGMPSRWHTVRIEHDTLLASILGAGETEVNSRHHQAVLPDTLAPGLAAVAFSPDGLVEGIESRAHRWVLGVQWHPERLEPEHAGFADRSRPLFQALVAAARLVQEPA